MPTTYGNDIVYCLKSHCGVRGYCRQKWVLQVQIICKFSNERTCKRNKDVQGLSCGFEVYNLSSLESNRESYYNTTCKRVRSSIRFRIRNIQMIYTEQICSTNINLRSIYDFRFLQQTLCKIIVNFHIAQF